MFADDTVIFEGMVTLKESKDPQSPPLSHLLSGRFIDTECLFTGSFQDKFYTQFTGDKDCWAGPQAGTKQ